jgi:uncharacterized membrane protein YdbT with pleckstrin-like domain
MSFAKRQLLPGEDIIVLARQHPLVLFRAALLNLLALVLLAGLSTVTGQVWFLSFFLAPLAYFFWEFWTWRNREYILTDRRVVKQEGVFSVSSFDTPLDKINNVFHRQSFIGRLLHYGEVRLETASEEGITHFEFLSRPVDFKNSVVRQRELYRAELGSAPAPPDIPRLIEELDSLRSRNIITAEEFEDKKRALLEKL